MLPWILAECIFEIHSHVQVLLFISFPSTERTFRTFKPGVHYDTKGQHQGSYNDVNMLFEAQHQKQVDRGGEIRFEM